MPRNLDLPLIGIVAAALVVALVVALVATPVVKNLAIRVKAVDVPKDGRRMHDHPPDGRVGDFPGLSPQYPDFCAHEFLYAGDAAGGGHHRRAGHL